MKGILNANVEYFVPSIEGLSVKTSWGTDYTQRDGDTYFDRTTYTGKQTPVRAEARDDQIRTMLILLGQHRLTTGLHLVQTTISQLQHFMKLFTTRSKV